MSDKPDFDPNQPYQPVEKPEFNPDQPFQELDDSGDPSALTTATTGLMNAHGFGPRLGAAGDTLMKGLSGVAGPLAGGSIQDLVDNYNEQHMALQSEFAKAAAAHPYISTASHLAGDVATLGTVGPAAMTAPGLAATGAAMGAGESDDLGSLDAAKNAAMGAGANLVAGSALNAVAPYAGKVMEPIGKAASWAADKVASLPKRALSAALGPSTEAIDRYLSNPEAINSAIPYSDQADKLASAANKISDQIGKHAADAWDTLSDQPVIDKLDASKALNQAKAALTVDGSLVGEAAKKADKAISGISQDLFAIGGNETPSLTEKQIKSVIQSLDSNIDWNDPAKTEVNNILSKSRQYFDGVLKESNPDYAQAMQPVADKTQMLSYLKQKYNLKGTPDGLVASDPTATNIQRSLNENKSVSQDVLGQVKDATGYDTLRGAKDYQIAKQFEGSAPNGSRRAVMGASMGGAVGGAFAGVPGGLAGGAIGSAVGGLADKEGGAWAKSALDGYLGAKAGVSRAADYVTKAIPSQIYDLVKSTPQVFGDFAEPLKLAIARGPVSLNATDYVLSQTSAEYRAQKKSVFSNKTDDEKADRSPTSGK